MSGYEPTGEFVASEAPRERVEDEGSFAPRTGIVKHDPPRLATETQALLRSRLRTAASLLLAGFLLFFVRNLLLPERITWLAMLHGLVLVLLGSIVGLLSSRRDIPLRGLRAAELLVFGISVAFIAIAQYQVILFHAQQDDATMALAAVKSMVIYILSVIAIYSTFIPNHWRRAAVVIMAIAATPSLVMLLLRTSHPELRPVAMRVVSFEQISDNVLMLVLAAATSTVGTHIINTLRTEAFEARQLGQYRLGERIGAGGMGEVYLAEHQLLKRPCAIKLIRPSSAANPKALARFEREVRATAHLSHWNTVEIYDYGRTDDGTFYYVMEYLPGLSLAELVERYGPLPPERVIHLLRQACDALQEAHAHGLIHRDIKPANIFAAERGGLYDVTKLLDFGLVKPTAEASSIALSQEGVITGSPLYMSPEQATGSHHADGRSDIYSLGAVAYDLLTGHPPFERSNAIGVMIAHARDSVTPPSRLRPEVPGDLERVVLRCLAKDPADRFPDARSMERALAACRDAGQWTQERAAAWWRTLAKAPASAPSTLEETTEQVV